MKKPATLCVHAGTRADTESGGLNSPIHTSTASDYRGRDELAYPRYFDNPNQRAVADKLAALEKCQAGLVFASGMAAVSTSLLALLRSGDHAVVQNPIYGGTWSLAANELVRWGIDCTFAPPEAEALIEAMGARTRLVMMETPANPVLTVVDLQSVVEAARAQGVLTLVDSTFASPVNQTPADFGVDLVLHSGTKYLGGHSDLSCGAVAGSAALVERIQSSAQHLGGCLSPSECYSLERSLKTLSLRVGQQNANAQELAERLESHPQVRRVIYPGLASDPNHEVARRQMHGFGAMVGVEVDAALVDIPRLLERLELTSPAISLGGVESTVCVPAETSHRSLSVEARAAQGITEGLLRVSVGIEDLEDLWADWDRALNQARVAFGA